MILLEGELKKVSPKLEEEVEAKRFEGNVRAKSDIFDCDDREC